MASPQPTPSPSAVSKGINIIGYNTGSNFLLPNGIYLWVEFHLYNNFWTTLYNSELEILFQLIFFLLGHTGLLCLSSSLTALSCWALLFSHFPPLFFVQERCDYELVSLSGGREFNVRLLHMDSLLPVSGNEINANQMDGFVCIQFLHYLRCSQLMHLILLPAYIWGCSNSSNAIFIII
jgi:hypothetical protein